MIPDELASYLSIAASAVQQVRWSPGSAELRSHGGICRLETTENGHLVATLERTGGGTEIRRFGRRFDAEQPWEELGSAQGGRAAELYSAQKLAGTLVGWVLRVGPGTR